MTTTSWRDAWILAAVAAANRGDECDLPSVLEAASWRKGAPPSVEELEHAVGRLVPVGLLRVSSDCYELTAEGKTLCDEAASVLVNHLRSQGGRHSDIDWLTARLQELPEPEGFFWSLNPQLYEEALDRNRLKAWARPIAWMLGAVAWANRWGRCDLSGVFFAADAINHAQPSVEDVERAVRRLVPAGLIDVSGDCYRLTPQGQGLWEEAASASESVLDTLDWLAVRLGTVPEDPEFEWSLDPRVHREAWDRYSEEFSRRYEEAKSKERREQEP